jgi:Cdc6-like AAA superfamily ATPase
MADQQRLRLQDAIDKLESTTKPLPLRQRELAVVHSAVTEAIAGNTGATVLVRGPAGSGKWTVVQQLSAALREWCNQHGKPEPVSAYVLFINHLAGLYGEVLQVLKQRNLPIGDVSEVVAEAKKQLEDVMLDTKRSSISSEAPLIVLHLYNAIDTMAASHGEQLQQLFKWAHTAGLRLILIVRGETGLTQTWLQTHRRCTYASSAGPLH